MATQHNKNNKEKTTPKSGTAGEGKGQGLDIIRKNLAKRALNVKFDLDDTDYQPIEKIGIGAYGVVCSAIDKQSTDRVAIKKIPYVFEALAIAKRTYREIKILKHFKHDNIISIREILKPKESYQEFRDIYVVFDLMESDLHRIIYSEQPLTEEHIRYFLYQILRGLKYIHSANVVHRDLKPSNLLVNEDCHVRIGDFGMARGVNSQPEEPSHYMTQYVATRWYRAPEILLSLLEYGTAVDMWSVGCIFAEMLGRKHLLPGKDYLTQVKLVLGLLGTPSEALLKNCQNDVLRRIIRSLGHRQAMPWTTLFPKASKKALDFVGKMLVMNPADRITVDRALQHPFLSKYHDPDDEPICVPSFEFDFEKELLHMDSQHLRDVIYKEIMEFHQPRTPTLSFLACLRPAPVSPKTEEGGGGEGGGGGGGGGVSPSLTDQLQAMMAASMTTTTTTKAERTAAGEDLGGKPSSGSSIAAVHENHHRSRSSTEDPPASQILGQLQPAPLPPQQEGGGGGGGEVFKKPAADRAASKKSPVSVETSNLQLPACLSDVEMLSAQSTDGSKAMDTHTPPRLPEKQGEETTKAAEKKGAENKTISEGTKALVKQALLSHRQRTESCGDDDKPRPVTAAQRQREREDKRKKKRDSRMKKMQEKKKEAPQKVELSDADKELLARWSCMQQKKEAQAAGGGHSQAPPTQSTTTPTPTTNPTPLGAAPTIVYLHPSTTTTTTTPSLQQHPSQGPSPPHPTPTSTPPSIMIPQGQVAGLVAGPGGPLGASQGGPVLLPCPNLPHGLQGQTPLHQGQVTALAQAGSGALVREGEVIPLEDLRLGGQLCISPSQAQALKEALNLSPTAADRAHSAGDPASNSPQVLTPPQAAQQQAAGFSPPPDLTMGPHHSSASPSLAQRVGHSPLHFNTPAPPLESGRPPPCDVIFGQNPAPHTSPFQASFAQGAGNSEGNATSHHPQNLAEFLERHCQKPEQDGSLALAGRGSSEALEGFPTPGMKMFGSGSAVSREAVHHGMEKMKSEDQGFPPCQYFSAAQGKPEPEFASKSLAQDHTHPGANPNPGSFQNALFPAGSSPSTTMCYSVQQPPSMAGNPPFFMPSGANVSYAPPGSQGNAAATAGLSFPGQGSVDGSSNVTLPFSRYSDADLRMLGSSQGAVVGFGVGAQPSLPHAAAMAPHPGSSLGQVSGGGPHHPSMGQAPSSITPHPPPQNPPPPQPAPSSSQQMVPADSYAQPGNLHAPLPMQTNVLAHHPSLPHHHLHHQHHHQHIPTPPHLHPHPSTERGGGGGGGGGELRVSAPKQGEVDLVAMLSSRLSSIFPPSLSLTPRGTGAGYGVGMDLDVLMADAADNAGRGAELSPLSSSLLADWLDLSGNISQADLDALEQDFGMTSPMAMSYSDFQAGSGANHDGSTTNWG